jgi:glycosyltransferase involved in cell wall biosynthesis
LPIGLNLASVVVAVSETSAQALRQLCGVTRPIYVVPPIVDISTPMTIGERPFRFEGREVQILTVAGLKKEKGLDYLIKAAEHVITVNPNVRFLIYGEGYLFERLESEIDSLNLRGKVFLAGSFTRNDLPGIMNTADIFVLPSITEGFPLSIVEAMAWGLPIAATSVGGIPELIEDGVTGLLCQPEDDNALAEIILTLVDNPLRSQALGDAAKKSYNNGGFKPECIVERYAEIYSIMLNGNGMKS